jgi:hypothetical protein
MQSSAGHGGVRKSRPAMNGGPTCLQTLARKRERRTDLAVKQAFYRLADEKRETILVACSKCDWRAAFSRDDLIATHGADHPMPNLLDQLAAPLQQARL